MSGVGFDSVPRPVRSGRLPVPVESSPCCCVTVNGRPLAPVQGEYKLLLADLPAAGDVVVQVFM